ncbi:N-methyl-L-tryptophan oxidase [Leucobacter sp. wl10]|uniref:N-methyl-L-tryptophan oxidase n=1 Tax=Leucobacter sp. wl10 TaxID=2304677 RepID=UPI000E5ADF1B|nr:N-methyl-L-tryptophan oxidase [Leucobacter sp. wl10]RGE19405.1 N-methyl-L-tryptophan oxidase [Leucobacter sp. wl10]
MHAEVIVIGLGAAGSYAAWKLAEAGAGVIGLEADDLVHTRGAYSGESRLFRAAYHEGAEYVPLLLESREEWLRLQQAGRRRILHETGVLSIGSVDAPQMARVRRSLKHAGVTHEVLSSDALRRRYPQHSLITDEIGVLDLMGGVLRPEAAVSEIQRRATLEGADLRGNQRVGGLTEERGHVRVDLEGGETLTAHRAIVSAGVHTPTLLPHLAPHLAIRPIGLTWFCPEAPEDFTPDRFPAFIRDLRDTHIFGAPALDGALVKAGYDARFGTIGRPADLAAELTREQRRGLAADVHRLLAGLPPHVARESMHMDIYTADKRPVLGPVSERVVVGTGYSGHGFKLTPAFGNALAAFATGRKQRHDLSPFSPRRFGS